MGRGLVIGDVLRNGLVALRKHPARCLLMLGVIPVLWDLPRSQLQQILYGSEIETSSPFMLASTAWRSILAGGLMLAAIELAAGRKAQFHLLARGLRFAPAVFVTELSTAVPMYFVGQAAAAPAHLASMVVLLPLMVLIVVRGIAWVPHIVDRSEPVLTAFRSSWKATRGSGGEIVLLILLVTVPVGALGFVVGERPLLGHLVSILSGPVMHLLSAQVYLCLVTQAPADGDQTRNAEPADPPSELPVDGTGWARDSKDDP